ncbi:MAG: RsfS/YbeB/iojap family protein [Desulfobacterales bacterium]|nr:RsfS/YbeB/iojap family protein [Desulfobacterales bacterium]
MTDDRGCLRWRSLFKAVLGRKAVNVVALDVRELTSIADVFIICSGRSNRQVSAIAEHVERRAAQAEDQAAERGGLRRRPVGADGLRLRRSSTCSSSRCGQFYDLEGLWSDARRIPVPAAPKAKTAAGGRTAAAERRTNRGADAMAAPLKPFTTLSRFHHRPGGAEHRRRGEPAGRRTLSGGAEGLRPRGDRGRGADRNGHRRGNLPFGRRPGRQHGRPAAMVAFGAQRGPSASCEREILAAARLLDAAKFRWAVVSDGSDCGGARHA